jgi:hypothetical protein
MMETIALDSVIMLVLLIGITWYANKLDYQDRERHEQKHLRK